MRKAVSLLLAIIITLGLVPMRGGAADRFTDVREKDWFYVGVMEAVKLELFAGTSETAFSPNGTMTRGMFVTVLGKLEGINTADYKNIGAFLDLPETAYYTPYVNWAVERDVCVGVGYNLFAPNRTITREEAMLMFYHYVGSYQKDIKQIDTREVVFTDIRNLSDISRKAITTMYSALVIDGRTGTTFDPKAKLTRAEAAQIFLKAYYIFRGMAKTLVAETELTGPEGVFSLTIPPQWQTRTFVQSGDNHLGRDDGSYHAAVYASLTDNPAELFRIDVIAESGTRRNQFYSGRKLLKNYELVNRILIDDTVYEVILHKDDSPLSLYKDETLILYRRIWLSLDDVTASIRYPDFVEILE